MTFYTSIVQKLHQAVASATNSDERISYEQALLLLTMMAEQPAAYRQGTLTRFVIDSYAGNLSLGEELIDFDEKYSLA